MNRKHYIALCGQLVLQEAMDLSLDRAINVRISTRYGNEFFEQNMGTQETHTRIRLKARGMYSYMLTSEGSIYKGVSGWWEKINTSFESQCHCFIMAFRVNTEQRVQQKLLVQTL